MLPTDKQTNNTGENIIKMLKPNQQEALKMDSCSVDHVLSLCVLV